MALTSQFGTRLVKILLLLLIGGCEFTGSATNHSSLGDNEYFEEPLSDTSKKFEAALHLSNEAIDALVEGRFSDVHGVLDEELTSHISEERLSEIYSGLYDQFGEFEEYLPMQWGFTWLTENDRKVVYSTKIVIHENYRVFYHFKFANDGKFDRILKIDFYSQRDNETLMQSVKRAYSSD